MKKKIIIWALAFTSTIAAAQTNYISKEGFISFYSHTPVEDITADNNEVGSIINTETGEIVFTLKMTDFEFEKKLMQRHFNENYVESDKFPTSTFKGVITNNERVDYSVPGNYSVNVKGDLTIHGVTKMIQTPGKVEVNANRINASAEFIVKPADFDIKIPGVVRNKIAQEIEVTVDIDYEIMQ